ncbi:hypothetical protein AVEN_200425-1, partial [Araneus ventricosus]
MLAAIRMAAGDFPRNENDSGGLVVRSRPRGQRIPGSKPNSTEYPPCMEPIARYIIRRGSNVLPLV